MKMTMITRLTERGQISLPVEIRNGLGIAAGCRLAWDFDTETKTVSVSPVQDRPVGGARAALGFASRFRALRDSSDAWLDEIEKGGTAL